MFIYKNIKQRTNNLKTDLIKNGIINYANMKLFFQNVVLLKFGR